MITDSALVAAVTDESFEELVLTRSGPVLVDFWAQWCPPCHMVAPVLEKIAAERAGTLTVVSVDYDANPVTGARYRVMSLPTLLLFVAGEPVATIVGAQPKTGLLARIDDALVDRPAADRPPGSSRFPRGSPTPARIKLVDWHPTLQSRRSIPGRSAGPTVSMTASVAPQENRSTSTAR